MLNSLGAERKPKGKQISMNMKLPHFICRRWRSAICTGKRRKVLFMSIFAIKVPVTIQSTLFCACGDHIKHTIPRLQSTLQFHARGDNTKHTILHSGDHIKHIIQCACGAHYRFHARGDNIKHTIPHLWRPHKAYNSVLAESTL